MSDVVIKYVDSSIGVLLFFFYGYGDHRDLHVLTHSFPTRRSSDLPGRTVQILIIRQRGHRVGRGNDGRTGGTARKAADLQKILPRAIDRKSTRLNSSH